MEEGCSAVAVKEETPCGKGTKEGTSLGMEGLPRTSVLQRLATLSREGEGDPCWTPSFEDLLEENFLGPVDGRAELTVDGFRSGEGGGSHVPVIVATARENERKRRLLRQTDAEQYRSAKRRRVETPTSAEQARVQSRFQEVFSSLLEDDAPAPVPTRGPELVPVTEHGYNAALGYQLRNNAEVLVNLQLLQCARQQYSRVSEEEVALALDLETTLSRTMGLFSPAELTDSKNTRQCREWLADQMAANP